MEFGMTRKISPMLSADCRVGIVGAGTSGAYLAKLLVQQGVQVTVFERAPYPRTEGCGILLVQSGMKTLQQGGSEICQKIIAAGMPAQRFEFRNLRGGIISSEPVSYAEDELPGMLVHRKAILEAILDGLPADCIRCNAELKSVSQTEDVVIAHFQDGSQWEGDLLVGADGILSQVRQFVVPGVELSYLGDLVWRGVVADQTFCTDGNFIVYTRGRGIYANFFDIGEDRTHWGFFVEKDRADPENGLQPRHVIPSDQLAKLPADARAVIEATPPEQIVSHYSYDIDPLPRLHSGRVVLIGDAAHAKSPARAKGMTSGLEDSLSLARHIAVNSDVKAALAAFEAERLPIVHEYQRTSREISRKIGRQHKQAA
jgi:2-polyprenyl-6-methoxyphenol hydroxylase-like FAD-dependent oxidoreductase